MGDYSPIPDDASHETVKEEIAKVDPTEIARKYQLELARKAVDENVIVVLETGCGKTLIAILLMRQMAHLISKPHHQVCVYLAPTVVLVHQQARAIQRFTDFKVGTYCGDDAKRFKTHAGWRAELAQYEVLVMTPQVLLRNLCHCFMVMDSIALLIFDECHYAQVESNHPYAVIMKFFYDVKLARLPRIFGMTASPISGKGASINSLQALLRAKVYTVNDKRELETFVVSPVIEVYPYSAKENILCSHKDKLEEIKRQCKSVLCSKGDDLARVQNTKKLLQKLHNNMLCSLTSLGLWGALQACNILLNGGGLESNDLIDTKGNSVDDFLQNEYLAQTASLLRMECTGGVTEGTADMLCNKLLEEPFFSQKVLRLVGILSNFRSRPDMKCIIFVNRIIMARSLAYILGQIKILSAWKCDFLVGVHSKRMSRKTMYNILEDFRSGKLNLLVATKVGEEGLDIQTCCLVIRFDLPETLASFIQSRGRARMPQSEYVFLVNSENDKEMNLMDSFRKDEDLMNMSIRDRKPNGDVFNTEEEVYTVGSTGATISTQTSISLLNHYCSKLPHDEYFIPMPNFYNVDDTEGIICHIILPSNAPIHHIVSAPQSSKEAAKKDACLRACKELHQIGALTEYLLPDHGDTREETNFDVPDSDSPEDGDSSFVLQEMVVPTLLKEPWTDVDVTCLNSYFIRLRPKPQDRQYKDFGLFVKGPLPFEAEGMKVDLHLTHGRSVLTNLVPSGVTEFSKEEILLALKFQEMCLKIILDRSEFVCGHVPLKTNKVTESRSSIFYLLLPVIAQTYDRSILVDWTVIRRCLSSPIFAPLDDLAGTCIPLDKHLQLADGPVNENDILNSLVYAAHKKSFFFISRIITDKNSYSPFNSSTSHIEYLTETFKIHLTYPGQPLLQAKQLFNLHNLLHRGKTGNSESHELDEYFFELPPELCEIKIIGFSKDIGSSLSLFPSIMHRLENFLVAIELKDMLSKSFSEGALVTAERILEALTTEKCLEHFSLERLEVLGDAFLKFAVGRHLFLKHEAFDEGQLTRRRSNLVNNSNLYKLATMNKLQGYIRDQEFDPNQIFALGRPCSVICTKHTESSIHCVSEVNSTNALGNRQMRCNKNHQWLTKKTIADVVEALIGAYVVDSGFRAAIAFLRWFGIQIEFEVSQVCHAWTASSRFMSLADRFKIPDIEGVLGHNFVHKGLVLQALVHPSYKYHGGGCYQRLEFLGDALLDYLITSYLYSVFPDLTPGQLTDLRSSLVNNNSFAQAAASGLYKFIICDHTLRDAIDEFVKFIRKPASEKLLLEEPPCPKALGDLVESCFGAILLDTGFDLNYVWKVMHSFFNPIMKYNNLQPHPFRELLELCNHHAWGLEYIVSKINKSFMVKAIISGKNLCITASANYRSTKGAQKMAAQKAIQKLKALGYRLKTKSLEEVLKTLRTMEARLVGYDEMPLSLFSFSDFPNVGNFCLEDPSDVCTKSELNFEDLASNDCPVSRGYASPEAIIYEIPTISSSPKSSTRAPLLLFKRQPNGLCSGDENCSIDSDVHGSQGKANAKLRLNELCVINCWKPPLYECCKEEGPSHLKLFTFKVMVVIEETEDVILECFGGPQAKKKAATEEAAEGALWLLKKEGYIK